MEISPEWKGSPHEEMQFRLQRTIGFFDLARILETSLSRKRLEKFAGKSLQLGRDARGIPEEDLSILIANRLMLFDPAFYIGFPHTNRNLSACEIGYDERDEKKLMEIVWRNTKNYIDELNSANAKLIKEVAAIPLGEIGQHLDDILGRGDEEARWRTLWAILADKKTTRISIVKKLKYNSAEEIKNGIAKGIKNSLGPGPVESTIRRLDIAEAAILMLEYRAYSRGESFGPEFWIQEQEKDLEGELDIYRAFISNLKGGLGQREGEINKFREEMRQANYEKTGLKYKINELETKLQKAEAMVKQPISVSVQKPEPKPSKEENHHLHRAQRAEESQKSLELKLSDAKSAINAIAAKNLEFQKKCDNYAALIELIQIRKYAADFYKNKKMVIICDSKCDDRWSAEIKEFCPDVTCLKIGDKLRQVQDVAFSTKYDLIFLPVAAISAHKTSAILDDGKTIIYDSRRDGPLHVAMVANAKRLAEKS